LERQCEQLGEEKATLEVTVQKAEMDLLEF